MSTTSNIYSLLRPHWAFMHDSYMGDWRYMLPSSSLGDQSLTVYTTTTQTQSPDVILKPIGARRSYLVPFPGESPADFDTRVKLATHFPIVQPIVDAYADAITPGITRELGQLGPYLCDLDGQGKSWASLVDEVSHWAACYGMFATVLDAPRVNTARNAFEEEQAGVSMRVISVHPTAIAWVVIGDDGGIDEFAYQEGIYDDTSSAVCNARIWVWTRTEWYMLEGTINRGLSALAQRNQDNSPLKQKSGMRGTHGTPGRVPVAFCYFKRDTSVSVPLGISLVGDAAKAEQLIYNESSRIEDYHRKATAFLAIPQGETRGLLEPEVAVKVGAANAFGYPSSAGAPAWVSPPSEMPAEIRAHIAFVFQLAMRGAGMELAADTSAQVQSGEALRIRSRDFESRAKRFAESLRAWEMQMLSLAAQWLGLATVKPALTYPDRFVLPDMAEDLARAIAFMGTFGDKLGPLGSLAVIRQALNASATLSDEETTLIMDEIHAKLGGENAGTSEIFAYDYESGIIEVNAALARKGLPPIDAANGLSTLVWKAIQEARAQKLASEIIGSAPPVNGDPPANPPAFGGAS